MKKSILDLIEETTDEAMPKEKKKKCEHCDADANESGFCGKCEVDERASQVDEDLDGFIKCPKCHGEGEYEIGDSFGTYVCDECNGDQIVPRRHESEVPLQRLRDFFPGKPLK